jgi:arylsulfatase A-like enzyme
MPDRPNVLVVLCDQMRGSAMSCAGDSNVETPNLDRLASQGVRFENVYSTYPICVPARFSLVTGEYAHSRFVPSIGWRMSPTERTFGHELGEADYETAWIGKWHLSESRRPEPFEGRARQQSRRPVPPDLQGGFEYWRGFELCNDHFDTVYFSDSDPTPHEIDGYQTDGLTDLTLEFFADRDPDRPFACVLSVEPPHWPWEAPEKYMDRWRDRAIQLRPNVSFEEGRESLTPAEPESIEEHARAYYAMIENLDDNVGRLLNALDEQGMREDTVVVFLSDHGELLGSHGLQGKEYPYRESANIPLVVSHLGGDVREGKVVEEPVCLEDIYPTLQGFAGLEPAAEKPGRDLGPLLAGQGDLDREGVLLEFVGDFRPGWDWYDETWRGFVTERYTYTVRGTWADGGEPWQLFDRQKDPYEQENLVDDHAHEDVARRLHGTLISYLDASDDYAMQPAFGYDGRYL